MDIQELRNKQGFISDLDGVLYHGDSLIPGAEELVAWLERNEKTVLVLDGVTAQENTKQFA